jgi:dTDP-4-dehydrorhamnose reductase
MKLQTVLVTGCRGQVGDQLMRQLHGKCDRLVVTDRTPDPAVPGLLSLDLTDERALLSLVRELRPQLILNPAAYTAVDKAESEPTLAEALNVHVPGLLAREAAALGALLVHYSTDYVFDGSGAAPRDETAPTGPLSVYGRTKLDGERAIQSAGGAHLIFRTSWVFGDHGHNFVKTMLKLGAEREHLRVVDDQVGAPTSAAFLARSTLAAVEQTLTEPSLTGLYHLCNAGETSWHGFAVEIFAEARRRGSKLRVERVEPIPSTEYPTPARRPLNSRLACGKFERTFAQLRPTWQEALRETLAELQAQSGSERART